MLVHNADWYRVWMVVGGGHVEDLEAHHLVLPHSSACFVLCGMGCVYYVLDFTWKPK